MKEERKEIIAMGDEACAFGAIDAGIKAVYGYPGTPSTEIFESAEATIEKMNDGRVAQWGANEKIAYEFALGTSYTGQKSLVTMKHVGLNVAMDPFVNSAITGVNGGLVVAVADDPGMHSSQNEQDDRYLAEFALIPCLEPSTPQEVYDFTRKAFELSEEFKLPILLRMVTRLAHSRGLIHRGPTSPATNLGLSPEHERAHWVLTPSNAKKQYRNLREKMPAIIKRLSPFNTLHEERNRKGIICSGMGRAYFQQLSSDEPSLRNFSVLEISAYPVDNALLEKFLKNHDEIFVFEENYPFLEDKLVMLSRGSKIHGRRDGTLPIDGELTPLALCKVLGLPQPEAMKPALMTLTPRPPRLCDGCGHADAFNALKKACTALGISDPRFFGDIGCYTLGHYEPYNTIDTCVEMGASAGMMMGAGLAGLEPSIGIIGDSTFFHSALGTLVTMATTKANVNLVVLDNRITAMTGQQPTVAVDMIEHVAKGVGFPPERIHTLIPLPKNLEANTNKLVEILGSPGPKVIIFKRECIHSLRKGLNR